MMRRSVFSRISERRWESARMRRRPLIGSYFPRCFIDYKRGSGLQKQFSSPPITLVKSTCVLCWLQMHYFRTHGQQPKNVSLYHAKMTSGIIDDAIRM